MITIISHDDDVHATRVIERLSAEGRETQLLDIGRFPNHATMAIEYEDPTAPTVSLVPESGAAVELTNSSAVWWRRPQFPDLSGLTDHDALGFAHGEWHEALNGMYQLLCCPWMNPPAADDIAHRKAHQLRVASDLGLRIPRTLMTSDRARAMQFIEQNGIGKTIYKIFAATQKVWRETRLVSADDLEMLDSLHVAPVIFQEYIPAVADLRVTVVGREIFPMAIHSKGTSYEVDFRVSLAEAETTRAELPKKVEKAMLRLMDRLGLVYGAIDLRLTEDGDYVFLEINPAGEFLFSEAGADLPITDAIVGWLSDPTV